MTQAVAVPARIEVLRRKARLGPVIERYAGWAILLLGAAWVVWSFTTSPSQFFATFVTGLNIGTLYALVALGYTMVYGIIELINFAHGDLFMLGTIVSVNVFANWLNQTHLGWGSWWALILTMVVSMIFCASLNVFTEFIAYRRLRNAPKLAPLITAVGFSFIFQDIGQIINGSGPKNWSSLNLDFGGPTVQGFQIYHLLLVVAFTVPMLLAMTWIVTKTRRGKAMRAVAADQDAARLMGIDVNKTISFTFALGGLLAGAAGTLYVFNNSTSPTTTYNLGLTFGIIAFTAAVLGGIGNLVGAVIGGLLIGVIEQLNNGAPHGLGQQWNMTVIFIILITLMVFKPEGLLGTRTTEKV
jgi:branched-chain amino acid transport system permease protein